MTRNPIRTPAFLDPVTGDPIVAAMRRCVPVTCNFFIMTIVEMPFGADPNVVSVRTGGAFHLMGRRAALYIIMLCAGAECGQGKGGSEQCGDQ